jgi:hypothetical protein
MVHCLADTAHTVVKYSRPLQTFALITAVLLTAYHVYQFYLEFQYYL